MNHRLQKKCFIAATSVHLLLILILLVGPAFLSSESKPDNMPVLDVIPLKTIDELLGPSGGNPNAGRPQQPQLVEPPKPNPPTPVVRQQDPPPTREPERVVEPPKPVTKPPEKEIDENAVKPSPEKKQTPQVKVNLTEVDRSKVKPKPEKSAAEIAREKARAEAAERAESERILAAARDAARGVRSGASKSTEIDMPGYGGGGVPYANFLQAVKSLYANAWTVPDGVTDDEATATASITILKDGTVREARITRSSGNDRVDQSVETVLNRIRFAVPLPDGAKENQRTVTIKFNVKAKLLG